MTKAEREETRRQARKVELERLWSQYMQIPPLTRGECFAALFGRVEVLVTSGAEVSSRDILSALDAVISRRVDACAPLAEI